jgi:8-oxo-dGTP diphosphatase
MTVKQGIKTGHFLSENNLPFQELMQFGLSVDCVIFGFQKGKLKVLLIKRGAEPYKDEWALPGDLVSPEEDLDHSANRILKHLTGLENIFIEQFHTFGTVERHPVGRVVTVGYFALVSSDIYEPVASHWASDIGWFEIDKVKSLAFDHEAIFASAVKALQSKVRTEPIGLELLPEKFTLRDLQELYEAILSKSLDKPNFRKKMISSRLLTPLKEVEKNVAYRPAKMYCFDLERYEHLKRNKFSFGL